MTNSPLHERSRLYSTLWLGDCRRAEFAPVFDELARRTEVTSFAGWQELEFSPPADLAPALIVVAQAYAGEFTEGDAVRLRRRFPTAGLLRIVGSWCEGELRSLPPPASKRYCWHQALAAVRTELARLEAGLCPEWGLPTTMSDEERMMTPSQPARSNANVRERIVVGIAATDPVVHRWLFDFCSRRAELQPLPLACDDDNGAAAVSPTVVLWDMPSTIATCERECRQIVRRHAPHKIIALANYPRREDLLRWQALGVSELIGKPVSESVLLERIESLACSPS
ncbi:MAG: hypothetical protein K8U03_04275 [Planctomycetia bacterium]|nr:hypothetical protein [Planctomycetia bacterium]